MSWVAKGPLTGMMNLAEERYVVSDSYRKGKRSALVDHQTKNREHKILVEAMATSMKRVMLVGGVAQRLMGKVAIVTGKH